MHYQLNHQNSNGLITSSRGNISFLAFVKHATFAGLVNPYFLQFPFRYVSFFFEFSQSFLISQKKFSKLPALASDPTETAYLSNRIGRAFADYFSKSIYGARYTHSYESAMALRNMKIIGKRPDFYCDTLSKQFAVEAKGFSQKSISPQSMLKHKQQASQGGIPVHFHVASVAFNLYNNPKINYYDPEGDNIIYDHEINSILRREYYKNALHLIKILCEEEVKSEFSDYTSFVVNPKFSSIKKVLVHKAIMENEFNNLDWLYSIEKQKWDKELYYIDLDGIGLANF